MLPSDSKARKTYPMYRGLFQYFPKALAAVAHHSYVGGQQHGHGENIHWDRNKSSDDKDALLRHVLEGDWRGAAWRALAVLEKELEENGSPMEQEYYSGFSADPHGAQYGTLTPELQGKGSEKPIKDGVGGH